MSKPLFDGWIPIRLYWRQSHLWVDWGYLGGQRFTDPFFEQTVADQLQNPFNLLFRHQTPIETLAEWQTDKPGLSPTGFIFHLSRCGSTLISQMLAALASNIVISEAWPIDVVLRAQLRHPGVSDGERIAWLRAVVSALGQPRMGGEQRLFLKFDSWHIHELPLIHRAFPDTPWLFVYRRPLEVIVSHNWQRGSQMVPGALDASLLGVSAVSALHMPFEEYCARVLAGFCQAALQHRKLGRGAFLNYQQLPEAVWEWLPQFFGFECTAQERERMQEAAQFNAKTPELEFVKDSERKTHAATDLMRQMAEQWVAPAYHHLEALRLKNTF